MRTGAVLRSDDGQTWNYPREFNFLFAVYYREK